MKHDIYCNPLPLPELGCGICCRLENPPPGGFIGPQCDYREVSDPEMLFHDGIWYMYPSVRQAYVSTDLVTWKYQALSIDRDLGYAPSVAAFQGKFLLTASALFRDPVPKLFIAATPLGPFQLLGNLYGCDGEILTAAYDDPSLFCEDGRCYLFWGSAPAGGGIFGIELDPENLTRALHPPVKLIDHHPENFWERYGEHNEHMKQGWNEGVSLFKHHGVYYLQYAADGTNFRHYALACYRSTASPLGPYTEPDRPMALSPHGIVTGTGHGGMVTGPNDSVWQFYTCSLRRRHIFERRVGMDRVEFTTDGEPFIRVTSTPQSITSGDLGWLPVSVNKAVRVSSFAQTNYGAYAVDECTHTWWAPDFSDRNPTLEIDLSAEFELTAARIIWAELNLDYAGGIVPEPVRFQLEFANNAQKWQPQRYDRSDNTVDRNIEFFTFPPVRARYARLTILCGSDRLHHGVTDFTLFAPLAPEGCWSED